MAWKIYVLFVFVLCLKFIVAARENYIKATFEGAKDRGIFNKLVVNRETNELYLAAVNHLYKLSPNLDVIQEVVTGPHLDDPSCTSLTNLTCDPDLKSCSCKLRPYYTKALVVDYVNKKLITCSTLYHGHCDKLDLDNITNKQMFPFMPMVANNATASTVMFIAPGPAVEKDEPQRQVLYVAASYTRTGLKAYREQVPAFCSRSLEDFNLLLKDTFGSSSIEIESQHRDTFPVRYIYGFGSDNFSYVLSIQKANVQTDRYVTKISRICQNDINYYSYAEVGLSCTMQNTEFNLLQAAYVGKSGTKLARSLGIPTTEDVLYTVFSIGDSNSPNPSATSAMCVYSLRDIRKKFTENIQECFSGIGNTGPDHMIQSSKCLKVEIPITDDFCGADLNFPVSGTKDIKANGVLRITNTYVTALVTATTYNYTVAFVGTKSGHIKKVVVEKMASIYKDITVDEGQAIYQDLRLDESKQNLYAVTERKVTKLQVHDCSQYTTCYDCLGAKDPYCGWCSFEDKCSPTTDCQIKDQSMRWLSYSGQQCTNITQVVPSQIQKGRGITTQELKVSIAYLPPIDENELKCVFTSYEIGNKRPVVLKTQGKPLLQGGVRCDTPMPNKLPPIPTGKDHIVMKLSIQSKEKDVVSTNFTFFDCSLHDSCTRCTLSNFPCTWCVQSHICTYEPDQECQGQKLVTGSQRPGKTLAPGPKSCPRIEIVNSLEKILVASNTKTDISVKAVNLYDFQTLNGIKCFFNIKDGYTVSAQVVQHTDSTDITCGEVLFDYIPDIKSQNVPFEILWDTDKPLDNPSNIQVMMYKCEVMAQSCGECLALDEQYLCGWCQNRCSTQKWCNDKNNRWLPAKTSICPNPKILKISPESGPLSGGTHLTITGQDMGQSEKDITVEIGNQICNIIKFNAPKELVCETPSFNSEAKVQVYINVRNQYKTSGLHFFRYVNPLISNIYPSKGPLSGGTRVTLSGDNMDAGSNAIVTIGTLQCIDVERNSDQELACTTTEATNEMVGQLSSVSVTIDNQLVETTTGIDYKYVADPTINAIDPKKSIREGGLTITIYGTDIDSVLKPTMVFPDDENPIEGPCEVRSSTKMVCLSPKLQTFDEPYEEVSYGFKMDGVKELYNLTENFIDYGSFKVFPNPILQEFPDGVESHQTKNQYLTINGQNLNVAVQKSEWKVQIGREFCNVTSVAKTQLTCTPPKAEPPSLNGDEHPEVVVFVGANFSSSIGLLQYEEPDGLSLPAIIGISVGAAILVVFVIIFCIAYLVKSRRSDDMMKKMRIQMDSLESRVANECKEAFAELQTDMTELTSDHVGQISIPFWDYRTFCMKVLFPGQEDHVVVRELQVDIHKQENIERGLQLFFQLISNKTFLLIFIRTLESNRNFQLKDRVNVASLISVALQTKMEYATDILKTLLADLIEKSVEGQKNHPKLLLRRNESVAEKMLTNWFTFLLYRFMKECAGEPLFMLYQAIKQQVSKGPVDAITSEARYSLSEDKLIRQQIQYKVMMVHVVDVDSFPQQTHPVKVLDCDTISQVKEKILDAIYKNAPFSSRPLKENLDLVLFDHKPEWLCPPNEKVHSYLPSHKDTHRLVLHDEDATSKMDSDCRRLNSLAHYKVPDGAYVALEAKNTITYNSSIISEKSQKYDNMSFYNRSPSLNRTTSPNSINIDVDNVKSYHLVRQHDSDVQKEGDRGSKMVAEIYLPRLLVTKGTLQSFVDDLFERIFSTANRSNVLPLAIKYMFDFLDDQALLHNIQDNETVHTWKSNSLPLRFWVNVMKNPNFVFDIYKSNIVDSCLSVVAQTFMDSCSVHEHVLGKDSPSSKLLYAKDIPKYKQWVDRYYQDIKMMPAISDQDMTAMLTEESRLHNQEFNTNAALYELYKYVNKYYPQLKESLEDDEFARRSKLQYKLEKVRSAMDGDAIC